MSGASSPNSLIDKTIGNAYAVVADVAGSLPEIRHVSANMEELFEKLDTVDPALSTIADAVASTTAAINATSISENNAAISAAEALISKTTAAADKVTAAAAATSATSSQTAATTSATAAAASQTVAATSATNAATSATTAATQATSATASKNAAATSEANALASKNAAAASAANATEAAASASAAAATVAGLSNVNNTSDADKPISTAQQAALNLKAPLDSPALTGTPTTPTAPLGANDLRVANTAHVQAAVAALMDSSPSALNTLNELAAALGDDPNFATTMTNMLASKLDDSQATAAGLALLGAADVAAQRSSLGLANHQLVTVNKGGLTTLLGAHIVGASLFLDRGYKFQFYYEGSGPRSYIASDSANSLKLATTLGGAITFHTDDSAVADMTLTTNSKYLLLGTPVNDGVSRFQCNGKGYFSDNISLASSKSLNLGTSAYAFINGGNALPMLFGTGGAEWMRLSLAGNLGIGTGATAAQSKLSIQDSPLSYLAASGGVQTNELLSYYLANTLKRASISTGIITGGTSFLSLSTFNGGSLAERLRVDGAGNLGLGVTPSAWGSSFKSLDLAGGSIFSANSGTIYYAQNAYHNGTAWLYRASLSASYSTQDGGAHKWFNAPSGTAGNAISFTQAMTLTNNSELLINTHTSDGVNKLQVTGGAVITGVCALGTASNKVHLAGAASETGYGFLVSPNTSAGYFSTLTILHDNVIVGKRMSGSAAGTVVGHHDGAALRFTSAETTSNKPIYATAGLVLPSCADDTAAASVGVPVGAMYRTGTTLKVRAA